MAEINDLAYDVLSGSTDGGDIAVTGTSSGAATTVHTAASGTDTLEWVTLKVHNNSSSRDTIYVQKGSGDYREHTVESKDYVYALQGEPIQNSLTIKVYSDNGDVLVDGKVVTVQIS